MDSIPSFENLGRHRIESVKDLSIVRSRCRNENEAPLETEIESDDHRNALACLHRAFVLARRNLHLTCRPRGFWFELLRSARYEC